MLCTRIRGTVAKARHDISGDDILAIAKKHIALAIYRCWDHVRHTISGASELTLAYLCRGCDISALNLVHKVTQCVLTVLLNKRSQNGPWLFNLTLDGADGLRDQVFLIDALCSHSRINWTTLCLLVWLDASNVGSKRTQATNKLVARLASTKPAAINSITKNRANAAE